MKHGLSLISLLFSLLFSSAQTRYVTASGAGTKDGSNWANAWDAKIFADTINTVPSGISIWLAGGNYNPTKDSLGNVVVDDMYNFANRQRTFMVPSGVKLYGGFNGNETSIDQRVASSIFGVNRTALDGGNALVHYADMSNSWNLITLKNSSENTVVDGFYFYNFSRQAILILSTINTASSPVVRNCNFGVAYNNGEGAIKISATGSTVLSKPQINNCYFNYNTYYSYFVPVYSEGNCKTEISNCLFSKSSFDLDCLVFSQTKGGAVTNCTFYSNGLTFNSPPTLNIYNLTDSLYISNCIIWNGAAIGSGYMYNFNIIGNNLVSLRNCNIQPQDHYDSDEPISQWNNISTDPGFQNAADLDGPDNIFGTTDDGLRLNSSSACKDMGFNDYIPVIAVTDIADANRVSGCTVDMGAYEYQIAANNIISLPQSTVQSCTQYPIPDSATTFIDPLTCETSLLVNPAGANPVTGIVNVCVVTDATVPFVNGVPYVQRRYNIEPLVNASSSTARLTVYYTQQEFDNYNAVAISLPQLPTSPSDAAGKANVRIEQDHGISLTGVPGTYNGTTVYIDPVDSDIIWNSTSNIWEVSFDITGFSGFFLTSFVVVPVTLVNFSGAANDNKVKLSWKTTNEYSFRYFDIEKSSNGTVFENLQRINPTGQINGADYNIYDMSPFMGNNYYRLKMTDIDGNIKYSSIALVKYKYPGNASFSISPNPASKKTTISITGNLNGNGSVIIFDLQGRKLDNIFLGKIHAQSYSTEINIQKHKPGIYVVSVMIGELKLTQNLMVK